MQIAQESVNAKVRYTVLHEAGEGEDVPDDGRAPDLFQSSKDRVTREKVEQTEQEAESEIVYIPDQNSIDCSWKQIFSYKLNANVDLPDSIGKTEEAKRMM